MTYQALADAYGGGVTRQRIHQLVARFGIETVMQPTALFEKMLWDWRGKLRQSLTDPNERIRISMRIHHATKNQ